MPGRRHSRGAFPPGAPLPLTCPRPGPSRRAGLGRARCAQHAFHLDRVKWKVGERGVGRQRGCLGHKRRVPRPGRTVARRGLSGPAMPLPGSGLGLSVALCAGPGQVAALPIHGGGRLAAENDLEAPRKGARANRASGRQR